MILTPILVSIWVLIQSKGIVIKYSISFESERLSKHSLESFETERIRECSIEVKEEGTKLPARKTHDGKEEGTETFC